jgi:hypothetical protein
VTKGADNLAEPLVWPKVFTAMENGPSNGGGENPTMDYRSGGVSAEIGLFGVERLLMPMVFIRLTTARAVPWIICMVCMIEDQTRGSVQNYAIWTNDGQVRFDNLAATTTFICHG